MTDLTSRAAQIKLALFDVDGVLTDGRLYIGPGGKEFKAVSVKDGHGLKQLQRSGVQLGVISGRPSEAMAYRLEELGFDHVFLHIEDKLPVFEQLLDKLGLSPQQCSFMGDDEPDLPLMNLAGLALAPADAMPAVLEAADWTSTLPAGHGAVREACDWLRQSRHP